jgi:hypothetical protein
LDHLEDIDWEEATFFAYFDYYVGFFQSFIQGKTSFLSMSATNLEHWNLPH